VSVPRPVRIPTYAVTTLLLSGCATVRTPVALPPEAAVVRAAPAPAAGTQPMPARGGSLAPLPAREPPVRTVARLTVGATGDVLMHDAVKRSAAVHGAGAPDRGYSWLFAPIADLLAEPDLTFANLETPVAPSASQGTRPFVFDAPPDVVSALRRAGVDLVSVANNHAFDQGRAGFEETLRSLDAAGMISLGAGPADRASGPVRLERNGIALAFLGYTYGVNQPGNTCPPATPRCVRAAEIDRDRIADEVRAAAAGADAVVVSIHWGTEYRQQPDAADVELGHRLADAGALLVLGHHPHVLQPVELYRRADGQVAVIAYSLGNFVSNQSRSYVAGVTPDPVAATRDGALLRVALARRDYGRGVVRMEVAGADVVPLWTENDTVEIDRAREPGRRPAIRVVAVDRALAAVQAELSAFPDPVPPEAQARWVKLRQREALYAARRAAVGAVIGEDLLRAVGPAEPASASPAAAAAPAPARPAGPTPSAGW
jgi:poly-gamma-glutamate capsule biosynthesis protein CapA/YwtB (metallophosphatase superfamily)